MEATDLGIERIYESLQSCMDSVLEGPDYEVSRYYNRYHRRNVNDWADCSSIVEDIEKLIALSESDNLLPIVFDFLVKCDQLIIEHSDDDEGFLDEFISVAESALNALTNSSLPDYQRIVWSIKLSISVECVHVEPFSKYLEGKFSRNTWSLAADALMKELNAENRYEITEWIEKILEKTGRQDEILPFAEKSSEETGLNSFLIEKLIEANQLDRAESILRNDLSKSEINDCYLILLEKIKIKGNDWKWLIDNKIYEFICNNSINTYEEIKTLAEAHNVWPNIRNSILDYFSNGVLPFKSAHWKKQAPDPLITMYYEKILSRINISVPDAYVLLDIAIFENNPENAYKWYIFDEKNNSSFPFNLETVLETARTIQSKYTEKAISLYMHCIDSFINNAQYENAVETMEELAILTNKTNQNNMLNSYINQIKTSHSRKRKLKALMTKKNYV
jgi:hypothetical protein